MSSLAGSSVLESCWPAAWLAEGVPGHWLSFPCRTPQLMQSKYTSADRLALWGRSAGGLTAGATLNRRPELFQVGHVCGRGGS